MNRVLAWLKSTISEAFSKTLAGLLAGFLLALFAGAVSQSLASFLRQSVTTSVLVIIIISLFAVIGVLVPATKLWGMVSRFRSSDRASLLDFSNVEESAEQLRKLLARVEVGPGLVYDAEIADFTTEVLVAYDNWQTAIGPFLNAAQSDEVAAIRTHIASRSLMHSREEAAAWLEAVKAITNNATRKPRAK